MARNEHKKVLQQLSEAYRRVLLEGNTLEVILPTLEFKKVKKQAKQYQYAESSQNMPAMSYTVVQQQQPVVTVTSDGKETENVAEPNDIIMSGPSREQYVVKSEKFPKLYDGKIGGVVIPEQGDRIVARVDNITEPITFTAPWGEDMILKRGDYLVKDPSGGYYRIAQQEYDQTYNPISGPIEDAEEFDGPGMQWDGIDDGTDEGECESCGGLGCEDCNGTGLESTRQFINFNKEENRRDLEKPINRWMRDE